jgi:hypothetical protein
MALRYPSDGYGGDADYVAFSYQKYSSRGSSGGGASGYIQLYMPENLPTIDNKNNWNKFTFGAGPIGEVTRKGFELGTDVLEVDLRAPIKAEEISKGIDKVRGMFDMIGSNMGPAIKQGTITAAMGGSQNRANQALSVTQGQIYNPNIELAYEGPALREFGFQFRMVPKSAGEAQTINQIIRTFKQYSAPKIVSGGMYEIPYVWQVSFMSGGGQNQYQNKFKLAACTDIRVQDNPTLGYYSAHQGGAAIETSLSLQFVEVDVITRKDHSGPRGM